ncbi:hypothetical protein OEZ86_000561 [Tetradesmus obliquus]|nr:hypothetical protein OEZ86_000561 [Tetradesmus obliquus]
MQTSSLGKSMLRRGPCRVVLGRPLPAGPASATFKYRRTAVVVCAAPSKQESDSKVNSSMPRLPPRKKPQQPPPSAEQGKQAPKSSSSSNRSRPKRLGSFAGGPNQPPPSESPQSVMQEKALAGLLAYTGLMGTVATAVAFFAPGVDLFGGCHWDAADVSLALKLMLPVYGLNLLIMLPNYSSWKLPEATVLLIDCLAAELLYRSVALQLAGGWIGDRIVEAGADDVLDSLLAGLPVLPTHASGQLVTVALLSVASGVLVLRNMRRMARRPQLALGTQGRQAAGQLLTDLQDKHRRQQRQQQQQEQQKKTDDSSSSSSAAASEPASKVASSPEDKQPQQQQQQQQQQDSASRAAADWAVAAAKASAGSQQQQQQGGPNLEPQWSRRIPSTLSGLALSQLVQGAHDIGQMTALGLSFVLTGNLAAPFAAAVVNQALMAALQKRGLERARQRSIAMAKHLAGITRQLRDAQRKQEEKKRQQQQQQGEQQQLQGEQQQLLAASADPTQDTKPANAAAQGASSASSDPLSSTAAAAPGAAAGAGTAVVPPSALAAATAAAGETDPAAAAAVPDAAAPAGEALVASRMERTIGVLDQLLGQLGETATAGPGPGK